MSEHDETKQFLPTPAPDDPTMLTPPVSSSGQSAPGAPTVALTPSVGSGVSRPISTSGGSSRAAAPPAPGVRRIGDYDLESEIARGGMGIVYKARQLSLNRPVAFKMILAGQFASAADVERFHVEAEAAAGLDHPNIVPIYEVGSFEGNHFFTMKLVDGRSMAHEMPRLVESPRDGVRLLVKVCRAIHYAHQHSILHRDLKPANILLDSQGEPHVTDFGLAKRTGGDSQLTQTGTIVGTPSYMAPEQAAPSKTPLTTAADVYSLGAMLYEILTGRPPFKGDSPLDTLMLVINKDAERPRSINASADRDLETIALKCLEKDPARRYGSAEALAEDLDRWLGGEPILARPIGSAERAVKWAKRRPAIAALAVAIGAVTVLGIAGVIWQWRQAVYERGQTANALIQVAQQAKAAEAARDQEAAQRAAAESARQQETIARTAADEQKTIAVSALDAANRYQYINSVTLADREWVANNIGHVDQLLAASPPALRNWEWHYLSRLAHMETAAVKVPSGSIVAFAISPNGRRATAVTDELTATEWDLDTKQPTRTVRLEGPVGMGFSSKALSADGQLFAASIQMIDKGSLKQEGRIWDTATGRIVWTLPPITNTTSAYSGLAFTPDSRRLMSASLDVSLPTGSPPASASPSDAQQIAAQILSKAASRLRLWDARRGVELSSVVSVPGRVSGLTFSPDGSQVAISTGTAGVIGGTVAVSTTDPVQIADVATGKIVATLTHSGSAKPAFSADGRQIAIGLPAGARLWSSTGGDERWSSAGKSASLVAFSPSNRLMAVALADRSIRVLDAATGEERARLIGNTGTIVGLAFGATDADIVSADGSNVRLFSWTPSPAARVIDGTSATVMAAGVTSDGRRLLATDLGGGLRSWDLDTGREVLTPSPSPSASALSIGSMGALSTRLILSGDGRRAVDVQTRAFDAGGGRTEMRQGLRVRDTATGRDVRQFVPVSSGRDVTAQVTSGAMGATAPRQMSMAIAMGAALDDAGTSAALVTMKADLPSRGTGPAPSPVSASSITIVGSELTVWSQTRATPVIVSLPDTMAVKVELSPDGSHVALMAGAYSTNGPVAVEFRVYDARSGRLVARMPAGTEDSPCLFSPDGARLAGETTNHSVTIWDLAHPGHPVVLPDQQNAVTRMAFSPDGHRLATRTAQGITLFDAMSGSQLLTLHESDGPFSLRQITVPGRLGGSGMTLAFSADGRRIIETTVAADPKGIKVTFKTWEGGSK